MDTEVQTETKIGDLDDLQTKLKSRQEYGGQEIYVKLQIRNKNNKYKSLSYDLCNASGKCFKNELTNKK